MGKSSIIRSICGEVYEDKIMSTEAISINVTKVNLPNGEGKTLILKEIPVFLLNNSSSLQDEDDYDLLCVCYEKKRDLRRFLEEYGRALPLYVPKLGVRTKVDMN